MQLKGSMYAWKRQYNIFRDKSISKVKNVAVKDIINATKVRTELMITYQLISGNDNSVFPKQDLQRQQPAATNTFYIYPISKQQQNNDERAESHCYTTIG